MCSATIGSCLQFDTIFGSVLPCQQKNAIGMLCVQGYDTVAVFPTRQQMAVMQAAGIPPPHGVGSRKKRSFSLENFARFLKINDMRQRVKRSDDDWGDFWDGDDDDEEEDGDSGFSWGGTGDQHNEGGFFSGEDGWFTDSKFWREDNFGSEETTTAMTTARSQNAFDFSEPEFDYKVLLDDMLRKQWGGDLFQEIDPESCEWIRESVKGDGSRKALQTAATVAKRTHFHPNPSIGRYLHRHVRTVLERKAIVEPRFKRWIEPIMSNMQQCWYHHNWMKSDDDFRFEGNSTTAATIKYSYFKLTCFR